MTAADPGPAAPATGDGAPGGRGQPGPRASGADAEINPANNR